MRSKFDLILDKCNPFFKKSLALSGENNCQSKLYCLVSQRNTKACHYQLINRAAMGRARFLLCTGFINRAAMGRARFLLCTGFINRAAMGRARFLLTARPWAERGSCFARDLLFLLLFFFMSVTRRKPPLGQIVIGTESRNL